MSCQTQNAQAAKCDDGVLPFFVLSLSQLSQPVGDALRLNWFSIAKPL